MLDAFLSRVIAGFAPATAGRLITLRQQYERGAFRELTDEEKRLLFGRWLIAHGRVNEGSPGSPTEPLSDVLQGCVPSAPGRLG